MRCEHCKAVMPDGAAFCPECGRPQTFTKSRIDAAAAGDQAALTDLYNRTYNAVYNTIRFMVKDEDAALDILQDSYIKAFDSLGQLQEASKFEAWVKRIAHNKAIDYLRQAKPVTFSSLSDEDSDEAPQFEDDRPENLPEVVIDRQETTRLINGILDSLPEEQRVCISLFYYDQLSVKEIAAELGITEATVKSRLLYGRKKVETQVRDLEKRGTKLYGLAPIPLLMLLLQGQDLIGRAPSQTILENVLAGSSGQAAAAGSAAEMAGQAAEAAQAAT
ncbi:MAG: sigma-70 family RNA polymerase sigma factor, partial [Lachnospiraceae bacterium]|nr:sigma-70 family RNA polymerase sigma factor [Lachnospiraceae bacterium]